MAELNQHEKYIIQGMLQDGKEIKEIATSLKRKVATVQKYLDGELDQLAGTIVTAQLAVAEDVKLEAKDFKRTPDKVKQGAIKTLIKRGISEDDSKELVRRALVQYDERGNKPFLSVGSLVHVAIQSRNAKDLMITETLAKKHNAVTIMTKEASERVDERKKVWKPSHSRKVRGNVYNIKEDRIIE